MPEAPQPDAPPSQKPRTFSGFVRRCLPQSIADWIGVAGFCLGFATLTLQLIDRHNDRANVTMKTVGAWNSRTYRVESGRPTVKQWSLDFGENGKVTAKADGVPVPVTEASVMQAAAVNLGRRPRRLRTATAVYYSIDTRDLIFRPKSLGTVLTEEFPRLTIDVRPTSHRELLIAVTVLDDLGQCYKAVQLDNLPTAERGRQAHFARQIGCRDIPVADVRIP